jgi:hypothetical protein
MNSDRFRHLLILTVVSLGVAAACYYLGGIIAEASGKEPGVGASFKAGGSLAGFLISFGALFYAYRSMGGTALMFRVTVLPKQGRFNRAGSAFTATITVMKPKSGRKSEHNGEVVWEAGGLTVHLRNMEEDDMVMIALSDGANRWESDFFDPLCQSLTLN